MEEMLARCGYRCDLCAARSDDPEVRQRLVAGWRKYFGHEMYTVENVRCDGCLADGRLADKTCGVRPCVIEKGIGNCAHCDDFVCEKLKPLMGDEGRYKRRFPGISDDDYNLCMRMFASEPRLRAIRKALGKE
ncbi:MAG: DUF3795 domain-containing protein [Candidatus Zixiibacteriota bacterium]|nr:MAG: DUF3795 domain-containing protein [candidate division Zixibacteria bacterium]